LALALDALAFVDIQDHLAVARPAVDRQASRPGGVCDPQQSVVALADRASQPSVLCAYFITVSGWNQGFSLTFLRLSVDIP
jgi:hypothetical protein